MRACFLLLGLAVVSAAYPTTYPFENEAYVPPEMISGTPNFTYDNTDTGGYVYYGMYKMKAFDGLLTDDDFPYFPHANGYAYYCLVIVYGAPPALPISVWNCSSLTFADSDFTGSINGQSVCNVGECCKHIIGKPKFGDDQMDWHTWLEDRAAAAMCDDIVETEYCILTGGHYQTNCLQYYLAPTDRLVMLPCFDHHMLYWLSCSVFKQSYTVMLLHEPASYTDGLSNEDSIVSDVATSLGDHVCNPYSYYYPSSTSSNSSPSSESASVSASDDSSSSGTTALASASMVVLFLKMF